MYSFIFLNGNLGSLHVIIFCRHLFQIKYSIFFFFFFHLLLFLESFYSGTLLFIVLGKKSSPVDVNEFVVKKVVLVFIYILSLKSIAGSSYICDFRR